VAEIKAVLAADKEKRMTRLTRIGLWIAGAGALIGIPAAVAALVTSC
jgi:hypothetical protein